MLVLRLDDVKLGWAVGPIIDSGVVYQYYVSAPAGDHFFMVR